MTQMTKELLTRFPWPWLPSLALVLFLVLFVGLVLRLCMKSRVQEFIAAQNLPLEDGMKYE